MEKTISEIVKIEKATDMLDMFVRLYPNNLMPLLVMYLAEEGLLVLDDNIDVDDPRVIAWSSEKGTEVQTSLELKKELGKISGKIADDIEIFKSDEAQQLFKKIDEFDKIKPFYKFLPEIKEEDELKKMVLYMDVPEDSPLFKIKEIFTGGTKPKDDLSLLTFYGRVGNGYGFQRENCYDEPWESIFDSVIYKYQSANKGVRYLLPQAVQRIISEYLPWSKCVLYDPFGDAASFGLNMAGNYEDASFEKYGYTNWNIENQFYSYVADSKVWAIGKLRLLAYHADSSNYELGNIPDFEGKVHAFVSALPFGMKIKNQNGRMEAVDNYVVRLGLDMITDDGLMMVIVQESFLYRNETLSIRKSLIDNKWLNKVVILPEGIFPGTKEKSAILFIDKGDFGRADKDIRNNFKEDPQLVPSVKLITVEGSFDNPQYFSAKVSGMIRHNTFPSDSQYDERNQYYEGWDNPETDLLDYFTRDEFERSVKIEDYQSIIDMNYDLLRAAHRMPNLEEREGFKYIPLSDVLTLHKGETVKKARGKVVRVKNLAHDFNYDLNLSELEEEKVNFSFMRIYGETLLISSIRTLRFSILHSTSESVYVRRGDIYAFNVNDSYLSDYIIGELNKDYVQGQLVFYGSILPRISAGDLLTVKILVPDTDSVEKSLKVQKETYESEMLSIQRADIQRLIKKTKESQQLRFDDYIMGLRNRKHRIQQIMNDLCPAFDVLDGKRQESGVLKNDDIISPKSGQSVDTYFAKIKSAIDKVENLVSSLVDQNKWGEPEAVKMDAFVKKLEKSYLNDVFRFEYEIPDDLKRREVLINRDELSTIFENIITNARKYGFVDESRKDYRIRIVFGDTLLEDGTPMLSIYISNNGEPLHKSVDLNKVFEWGYGEGTGLGLHQAKNIVEHYGGRIALHKIDNEYSGFCVEYQIDLPINM